MLDGQKEVRKRVLISSIFRLAVGYLFLSSLFMNIVQNIDVVEIFYDVLALEFVENIDDTTFALGESLKCIFYTVMIDMGNYGALTFVFFAKTKLCSQKGFLWKDNVAGNQSEAHS